MKKETTYLVLLALLLGNAPTVRSQDEDLDDSDLKSLLESDSSSTSSEPQATAPTPVEDSPAPVDTSSLEDLSTPDESLSSETVDLDSLEAVEDTPSESAISNTAPQTLPAEDAPFEPPQALESLPSDNTATVPETSDELEALRKDMDEEGEFVPAPENMPTETVEKAPEEKISPKAAEAKEPKIKEPEVFDVGNEERVLLTIARNIEGQISDNEWNEVATAAKVDSYTVVPNDWLFKISKKVFGSGFYYPKIWSLNSYIMNPHYIEPGMILSFTTGSGSRAPEVKLGSFTDDELNGTPGSIGNNNAADIANFGEDAKPAWLDEKKELSNQGVYFQYASEETMEDLTRASENALNREYENYEPPRNEFDIIVPKNYDKSGFDKSSKIFYSFKEGFYLSTFLSTNIVQDFGALTNGPDENIWFSRGDRAYVKFDESINALAGDKFSVYSSGGKVKQANSDREGFKYTIVGHIKLIKKIRDKWEVEFTDVAGTPQRGDRITVYTPKIERITRTYNSRLIEAAVMTGFEPGQNILGYGDVVYIDRGRADGVEMGNTFEIFGFKDRLTQKNITDQPTYKIGEIAVITLTDNFATAIVTKTIRDFYPGDIAITKTKESYLREMRALKAKNAGEKEALGGKALEELDVELNLENLNDDLLKEADKIQLTEDELAELEREEREKSVIKDSEKDLKSLERLESEIENAENILNDAKLDEDKLLENEDINALEKKQGNIDQDSLDEIEENLGKRYIDEDLNSKDNPYGLTEFDVEEIDELLNTEKNTQNQ